MAASRSPGPMRRSRAWSSSPTDGRRCPSWRVRRACARTTWRRRLPGSPTWAPCGSRPGAKGATMVQADPLRSRCFAPSALRMTGSLAPRREMMKPTRRVILSERAVRARSEGSVVFVLGPLASGRVQLGVHESTQLREAHGRVAPRLVEQSLRGCLKFPLEGARPGRRCHLYDDDMRVLPGAGNFGEQQI